MANNVLPLPLPVQVDAAQDIFGNLSTSIRTNQIEVPLNDTNWATFVDITTASGGSAAQASGQVTFSSGTNTNGAYKAISKDPVQYRSGSEIGWGWTWRFPTVGVVSSYIRIGATDATWANGVWVGYEAATFGVTYSRGGVIQWTKTQSQWLDHCDGTAGSNYTLNGAAVAMDPTKDQLIRVRAGLFGHAGFIAELRTPDGDWITILQYTAINADTVPVFADFDLKIAAGISKTAAGATNLQVASACWAGWTGLPLIRMNATISDRSLVQLTRSVIEGKTTGGGGGYVPVKVNPSGALVTDASGSSVALDAPTLAALETITVNQGTAGATQWPTSDTTDREFTNVVATVTAIGSTTVHTPAAGKSIRLHWMYAINDPTASSAPLIQVFLGATEYYRVYALSKRQQITGPVNGALSVTLSAAASVAVTAIIEEV
ncbi:MAG: hypothetical protein WC551_10930 [Patescibacteria group bacterium]